MRGSTFFFFCNNVYTTQNYTGAFITVNNNNTMVVEDCDLRIKLVREITKIWFEKKKKQA